MRNILGSLTVIRNGFKGFQQNESSILSYRTSVLYESIGYYMDIESPFKEISQEAARESLISISYTLPGETADVKSATTLSSNTTDEVSAGMNNNGIEKYISELISISNTLSPDSPGKHES
ncbi:hypothetical protein LINPERHAP2_LOCUS30824 [Linum perenne]